MKTIEREPVYKANPDADIERLYNIARETNAYISRGEESVLTFGHSGKDDPDRMGVAVGCMDNFTVQGDILYADLHIDDVWKDSRELKSRRRKSLEIWSDDIVSCGALLCKNRPELELGMVRYQTPERSDMTVSVYDYEEPEVNNIEEKDISDMSPSEIQQLFQETLAHSDLLAKFNTLCDVVVPSLQEKLSKLEDTLAPLLAEEAEQPENEALAPELEAESDELATEGETGDEPGTSMEELDEGKKELDKNDVSASANNTYVADLGNEKEEPKEDEEEVKKKKLVERYQKELLDADEELQRVVKQYQMEVRRNQLQKLSDIYHFDVDAEVNLVSPLTEDQFENHKKLILTKYQRLPIGRTVSPVTSIKEPDIAVRADKAAKARELALKDKIDFKTALERIQ